MKGRVGSLLVAAAVLATACAGAETDQLGASEASQDTAFGSIETGETGETGETDGANAAGQEDADGEAREPMADADSAVRREIGLALRAESDVPTNLLPPVEVHDVGQDRMVNFRNIFPAERPVLLWMWAPY